VEELLGRLLIPTTLHENIEDITVLIDRPPQIVPFALDRQKHLIEVPFVAWPRALATQLIGALLAELAASLPDGLIGHEDSSDKEPRFRIPIAQAEAVVQPHPMAMISTGKRWCL